MMTKYVINTETGISEKYVKNDNGKTGVVIGELNKDHCYPVVDCETGRLVFWHFKDLLWPFLLPLNESESIDNATR